MNGDTKEIQLSDEEYANLERLAKKHNITVDEAMWVACLVFFNATSPKIFEDAKKIAAPHVLKVAEEQIEAFAKAKIGKPKPITDEERKMFKLCHVDPGSWFTITEVGFYAVLKDGKVTVPKEVIEHLKLEEDQLAVLKIDTA